MKLVTIQTSYPNFRLLSSQHPMYSASLKILTQRFSGNISATNENFSISENFSIKFYTPIGNPYLQNTTKFYLKITSNSDKVTPHSARSFSDSHCIMVHIHNHQTNFPLPQTWALIGNGTGASRDIHQTRPLKTVPDVYKRLGGTCVNCGLDGRLGATADVGGRNETFLRVGAASDTCPAVALVRLDHVELFTGGHRYWTLAWCCTHTAV